MLKHYSHIRMEAKRRALEAIVAKPECKAAEIPPSTSGEPSRVQAVANPGAPAAIVN